MILMRHDSGWKRASLTNFGSEAEMQQILAEAPDLIPGCAGTATVRELAVPGAGFVDLVCIDDVGALTLVECKLAKNPEVRREVVGQIFAYASGLDGMTYDEFASRFALRAKQPLITAVQEATASLSEPTFKAGLEATLASGHFRLVLAVDEITDELKKIVEYLNRHLADSISLMALELGYLSIGGTEILVPATYGAEVADRNTPTANKRSTEEAVRAALQQLPEAPPRETVEALWAHAEQHGAAFKGGTGIAPSAGFYYAVAGKRPSVWSLYVKEAGPVVTVNLGSIAGASMERAEQVLQKLRSSEALSQRLEEGQDALTKYPSFDLADLHAQDPSSLHVLQTAISDAVSGEAFSSPPSPGAPTGGGFEAG